ncbi:MAG TPA: proline--tRNA ligase [Anaerolineae bacterium]|nr:proline--tRNA ligase [Anaerolineae bacterium]
MRLSHHFGSTLREIPAGVEALSHQLLLRAGFIRQLGQGLFSYLPLARRSLTKIENIMREEMNAIGGQELTMPVAHPAEVWQATGRWYSVGPEMARFKDRKDRDMVLAMTHEEVVADLCKTEIKSYRQLPQLIYHIQTKFRDDPRPRAGLIRVREFTMKDSYSLDLDEAGLDRQYRAHYQAYFNIFNRCGVPAITVGADVGMMGGSLAHEFMYLTPIGEDTLVLCRHCGYAANRQIARFAKPAAAPEELKALEKVPTPETKTIEALATLLGVPKSKTAKAVFMIAGHDESGKMREEFVFAVVRGDMEVNETKLGNALKVKADWLRPATDDEIRAVGAVPGYASPIGLKGVTVVVDDAVPASPNLVAGANEEGYHLLNTNTPRDYAASIVADIAAAGDGDACVQCGQPLITARGVEIGNIFKLGTDFSEPVGATYLAADGTQKPIVMGSYGIGSGRLLACVAEEHHDDKGLVWPITLAPYHVHLVLLAGAEARVLETAERVYHTLLDANIEVLYDDRDESPGVKFADADLIGIPIRLTVSARSLGQGGVEMKRRDRKELEIVAESDLIARLQAEIRSMFREVQAKVVEVPFRL